MMPAHRRSRACRPFASRHFVVADLSFLVVELRSEPGGVSAHQPESCFLQDAPRPHVGTEAPTTDCLQGLESGESPTDNSSDRLRHEALMPVGASQDVVRMRLPSGVLDEANRPNHARMIAKPDCPRVTEHPWLV